jgi:hypothetical protein
VLEARCGEGGYHYIVAADCFELFDGEEENGESAVTGRVVRTGLERMATGLRGSRPGMQVPVNAPGRRTASDTIWLMAKPLLESAADYGSKEMILQIATLAWNFTLFDPIEQEEKLMEIADLFQCPERMEIFHYLVDRKALLFPEDERIIWKVEMESAL